MIEGWPLRRGLSGLAGAVGAHAPKMADVGVAPSVKVDGDREHVGAGDAEKTGMIRHRMDAARTPGAG